MYARENKILFKLASCTKFSKNFQKEIKIMKKFYRSYKIQDDSIEAEIEKYQSMQSNLYSLKNQIAALEKDSKEQKDKIIYLMQHKHCKEVTVQRVRYYLSDNELKSELLID